MGGGGGGIRWPPSQPCIHVNAGTLPPQSLMHGIVMPILRDNMD